MKAIRLIIVFSLLFAACNSVVSQDAQKITEFDLKKNADAVLIDVRTPEEFSEGHLPGAKNINVHGENFKAGFSGFDKKETIYVYCRSGSRSAKAQSILQQMGFLKIINLEGGFLAWKAAEKPIER